MVLILIPINVHIAVARAQRIISQGPYWPLGFGYGKIYEQLEKVNCLITKIK